MFEPLRCANPTDFHAPLESLDVFATVMRWTLSQHAPAAHDGWPQSRIRRNIHCPGQLYVPAAGGQGHAYDRREPAVGNPRVLTIAFVRSALGFTIEQVARPSGAARLLARLAHRPLPLEHTPLDDVPFILPTLPDAWRRPALAQLESGEVIHAWFTPTWPARCTMPRGWCCSPIGRSAGCQER